MSIDSNRLWNRLAAAHGECSRHVHWSVASGPWCSCQHRPALFSPTACFLESCHTRSCVYDNDHLLNKRTPTHTTLVKVRQWPSCLSHVINVQHWELSSVYCMGQIVHQTQVMAVNARRRQAAYAQSCCIQPVTIHLMTVHASTTKRIPIWIRILQIKFEF